MTTAEQPVKKKKKARYEKPEIRKAAAAMLEAGEHDLLKIQRETGYKSLGAVHSLASRLKFHVSKPDNICWREPDDRATVYQQVWTAREETKWLNDKLDTEEEQLPLTNNHPSFTEANDTSLSSIQARFHELVAEAEALFEMLIHKCDEEQVKPAYTLDVFGTTELGDEIMKRLKEGRV